MYSTSTLGPLADYYFSSQVLTGFNPPVFEMWSTPSSGPSYCSNETEVSEQEQGHAGCNLRYFSYYVSTARERQVQEQKREE